MNFSRDFWSYADTLNFAENAEVVFYGCNTANGKFAQYFANKQHVTTYAQTDYANKNIKYNLFIRMVQTFYLSPYNSIH